MKQLQIQFLSCGTIISEVHDFFSHLAFRLINEVREDDVLKQCHEYHWSFQIDQHGAFY